MDILIRQVRIIDPSSPFNQQQADIFIQNGFIADIGILDRTFDREINIPGLYISPGWTDIFSDFCDPGFEYKETLESGSRAAVKGGYTDVFVVPNTNPVLHNKSGIEYVVQKGQRLPVNIYPIGAVSKNAEGKELAEMYDMYDSGAVAFSDGISPIQSSGLLLKGLQYIRAINKTIIQVPDDRSISTTGLMNEGILSTRLGLPGKPAISEELMIARDIELARYTESKIHFTGISTAKSVKLIEEAKDSGISVTCSVTPYHLWFSDEDLHGYDTHLKVNPPMRTIEDKEGLKKGIRNGIIDCIASHHMPQDTDHKIVEFEYAHFGMTGLETAFAVVRSCLPDLSLERMIELFCTKPRSIFDLAGYSINKNKQASLSLFNPGQNWTVENLTSKSKNSPFIGIQLTGKPLGIINKEQVFLNE